MDNQFPEKIINNNAIANLDKAKIILNAFRLDVSQAVDAVYKYEIKFTAMALSQNKEKDLSAGPRNDVAKETRRVLLWELYQQLLNENRDFFTGDFKNYVYDCGINFYSVQPLLQPNQAREFHLTKNTLSPESQAYLGQRMDNLKANLLRTEVINISSTEAYGSDRSAAQFLDILSNQDIYKNNKYYCFSNRIFLKNSVINLDGDPRIMKEGMQKNVRPVGQDTRFAQPIIQIDAKKSAFFPEMDLAKFASIFLRIDNPEQIYEGRNIRDFLKQLKGLSVITNHMSANRIFVVTGLTDSPSSQVTFAFKGKNISVVDYFREKYNREVRFPALPCAIERRPQRESDSVNESFYPLEVLVILPGQRVSIDKQTPKLTEQMIRKCQVLPTNFQGDVEKQKQAANITNQNPFFRAYNVRVDDQIMNAEADILYPPAITYGRNQDVRLDLNSNGELIWKLRPNMHFLLPAKMCAVWAAAIVQAGVQADACTQFVKKFVCAAKQRGLQIEEPSRYENMNDPNIENVREMFKFYKDNSCLFVLWFSRDKTDPHHHTFKLMEVEFGIITQHVTGPTVLKAIGDRGAFMVIDNLLLKFNQKLGGINNGIVTPRMLCDTNRSLSNTVVENEWLGGGKRMFFGLDMSHAPPQSFYERKSGIPPSQPTIVGMAYTINGKVVDLRGTYWMQQSRIVTIKYLKDHVRMALLKFKECSKAFPEHVVVFRAGVSEGEFLKVSTEEKAGFEEAFNDLANTERMKIPSLMIIVCQRGSNYRIIPQNINPRDRPSQQNCYQGTVVDGAAMHPLFTEFLLMGHITIQGTGQPVRCTVVVDTNKERMPLQQLEYMTYHLCYAHGIVTSPVSVPAPLYSASQIAKRGRNNYRCAENEADERGSGESGRFVLRRDQDVDRFFVDMGETLKPTINTKFWA